MKEREGGGGIMSRERYTDAIRCRGRSPRENNLRRLRFHRKKEEAHLGPKKPPKKKDKEDRG